MRRCGCGASGGGEGGSRARGSPYRRRYRAAKDRNCHLGHHARGKGGEGVAHNTVKGDLEGAEAGRGPPGGRYPTLSKAEKGNRHNSLPSIPKADEHWGANAIREKRTRIDVRSRRFPRKGQHLTSRHGRHRTEWSATSVAPSSARGSQISGTVHRVQDKDGKVQGERGGERQKQSSQRRKKKTPRKGPTPQPPSKTGGARIGGKKKQRGGLRQRQQVEREIVWDQYRESPARKGRMNTARTCTWSRSQKKKGTSAVVGGKEIKKGCIARAIQSVPPPASPSQTRMPKEGKGERTLRLGTKKEKGLSRRSRPKDQSLGRLALTLKKEEKEKDLKKLRTSSFGGHGDGTNLRSYFDGEKKTLVRFLKETRKICETCRPLLGCAEGKANSSVPTERRAPSTATVDMADLQAWMSRRQIITDQVCRPIS